MESVDALVIGAGVVGLAAASALGRRGHRVCVIERETRPGMGASTHNSQVIHAGIYYPVGSLKARYCVDGARMLVEFCEQNSVAYARCGKLIVAYDEGEIARLETLKRLGDANGAEGLDIVDHAFIRRREPYISAAAALFSPSTGVIDASGFVKALVRQCDEAGVVVLPRTTVINGEPDDDALVARTQAEAIRARTIVNAAGLYADEISSMFGGTPFQIYPCRGEYVELAASKRFLVNALVYPLPHEHGLGVHLTKSIDGHVALGPTTRFQRHKDDYEDARLPVDAFLEPARRLLPDLALDDLRLGGSGIRAKLHPPRESFADFLIARDDKCPRLVQTAGIESPGLTASLAIGERIAELVEEVL